MVYPDPINGAVDANQARKAIINALVANRWGIPHREPGRMIAKFNLRKHSVKVEISYDDDTIRIKYLDSSKLRYRKSAYSEREYIHKNYNVWIRDLARAISVLIASAELDE